MGARRKSRGRGAVIAGMVLILLPVLYILSTGPVLWLWSNSYLSNEAIKTAYTPLFSVIARSEWAKEAFVGTSRFGRLPSF
jgi:hypothetical protein